MTSSSQDSLTAADYISSQLVLEREAKELMPYDPNSCTYASGPLRQQVYACLTCFARTKELAGVCYSCSIQCHSDHNIVELFTKRNFTCDCGTTRLKSPCNLRSKVNDDIPSNSNIYNHNFEGKFCDCARDYNPTEETGNMLQCILGDVCKEDWFHDYCIMGLPKFKPEKLQNEGVNMLDSLKEPELGETGGAKTEKVDANDKDEANDKDNNDNNDPNDDDNDDEVAIDGFPRLDDFDCFICWKCVANNRAFFDSIKSNDTLVEDILQKIDSASIEERNEKLLKQETHSFLGTLTKRTKLNNYDYSIFLKHNHEENFTKYYSLPENSSNPIVKAFFTKFPYLLKDDIIYEPPPDNEEDEDENSSIFDLGAKALSSLPRVQAIQGVQAYENIKDKLKTFLTPFAQDGKVVNKEDIESFFSALKK